MDTDKLKDRCFVCSQCGNEVLIIRKGSGQLICCGHPLKPGSAASQPPQPETVTPITVSATAAFASEGAHAKSPFLKKSILCPVCHWSTENHELKSKLCVAKEKEDDTHVTEYTWRDPDFSNVYPPYYVLFYCERCGYTDFIVDFHSHDNKSFLQYNHFADMMFHYRQIPGSVMNLLIETIDITKIDFEVSVSLHVLALHIQTLVHNSRTHYEKLARLYLRTAWLFRDSKKLAQPETIKKTATFLRYLHKLDPRIPVNEQECMEQAISHYMQAVDKDSKFDDPVTLSNTIFFIADLLSMTGKYDQAIDMVTALAKEDTDARRSLSDQIVKAGAAAPAAAPAEGEEDKKGANDEAKTLKRKVGQLSMAMEKIREKLLTIRHKKLESMRARIVSVAAANKDATKEELVAALTGLGLTDKDIILISLPQIREGNKTTRKWEYWHPFPDGKEEKRPPAKA